MAYDCRVYRVLIASPSDVEEEQEIAVRVIQEWNDLYSYSRKVVLLPLRWETHIERLRQFKEKTYPKGLVENYRKIIEFRDKFARQLELKVRDLQRSDATGLPPLSLEFLSIESGEKIGSKIDQHNEHITLQGLDNIPAEKRDEFAKFLNAAIAQRSYIPIALALENSSSSGVRNLYVELNFKSSLKGVDIAISPIPQILPGIGEDIVWYGSSIHEELLESKLLRGVEPNLGKFEAGTLQSYGENDWRICFEWDAIQPHRIRLIKPVLYVLSPETSKLLINAKVFVLCSFLPAS